MTEEKNYDDFNDFVRTQIKKMHKNHDDLFNEINESAKKYHEERCKVSEENREDCLDRFMGVFAQSMLEGIEESRKSEVKSFGFIIDLRNL